MAWTEAQYAAYLKRQHGGLAQRPRRALEDRTPRPPRQRPKHTLASTGYGSLSILVNILGVALQEHFPGVFVPIPALGIHWGDASRKLGVNACGWARAGAERDGWTVVPCLPAVIMNEMPQLVRRVKELLCASTS